jgi:acetolactate decarboxylase
MKIFNVETLLFMTAILLFTSCNSIAQPTNNDVKIVGAMKNVMWKGQLFGNIDLETIAIKQHLYGIGPVEYLAGELLIFDGKSYKSTVLTDKTMKVEETYQVKAPFFGYANIAKWNEQTLPDNIQTISQLEAYLEEKTKSAKRPFLFKLNGTVETAKIHIVNLPKDTKVSSPEDAHKGKTTYTIENQSADILGFFSTEHKAIFTHHDTFLHMHLITADRGKMGHLDDVMFKKGTIKLYLPAG